MSNNKNCEISSHLFNHITNFLKLNNHTISENPRDCDVFIINTCAVVPQKVKEANSLIKEALNYRDVKLVVVFGCMNMLTKKQQKHPKLILIKSKELGKFNDIFKDTVNIEEISEGKISFVPYQKKINPDDYFILISQGCMHACSYCNVKKSKGNVASKSIKKIKEEVELGLKRGHNQLVLMADDCGSYGRDIGTNILNLLRGIFLIDHSIKLKIMNFYPEDFNLFYHSLRELLLSGRITYIHIPFQSGSSRILRLMNRNYNLNELRGNITDLRKISPKTWLYTHVLFNFPTETLGELKMSISFSSLFDEVAMIPYCDNPETAANSIHPKVGLEEQKNRITLVNSFLKSNKKGEIANKLKFGL